MQGEGANNWYSKHPLKFEELHENYRERTNIEGVFVDTKLLVDAFSNLVTSDSYNISRFFSRFRFFTHTNSKRS